MIRPAARSRLAARPLQMQVAENQRKSYAEIMGALKTKVAPKWDDGIAPHAVLIRLRALPRCMRM